MTRKQDEGKVPRPEGRGTLLERLVSLWRPIAGINRTGAFLRRNWMVVKGCLIFAICIAAAMLIRSWVLDNETLQPFFDFTASATGTFLRLFGTQAEVVGSHISSPDFSLGMMIVFGCTGLVPIAIFVSAVVAYPCSIRQKLAGIALGAVALYALNLVRTVTLFYIGIHFYESFFDEAHVFVWQPIMILAAILLWLFWVEKIARVTTT